MIPYLFDFIGVAVFAFSGALAAGRKGLDLIGVLVLGLVTATGGGTIRDLLLDRHPIFWLADPTYIVVIASASLISVVYVRLREPNQNVLLVADGLGLALFSVAGAQIAQRAGMPAVACIVLGTITGSAGGLVRDVLTNEIPLVLRKGDLYASAAIGGLSLYFLLELLAVPRETAAFVAMGVVALLRFAAIRWRLQVPVFKWSAPSGD